MLDHLNDIAVVKTALKKVFFSNKVKISPWIPNHSKPAPEMFPSAQRRLKILPDGKSQLVNFLPIVIARFDAKVDVCALGSPESVDPNSVERVILFRRNKPPDCGIVSFLNFFDSHDLKIPSTHHRIRE